MLIAIIFLVPAMGATASSLWARRATLTCRWERCATIIVGLLAIGAVLTSPVLGEHISTPIHQRWGWWNCEDVVGNIFLICAACGMSYMGVGRLPWYARTTVRRCVDLPAITGITIMLFSYMAGGGDRDCEAMNGMPLNGWMRAYWLAAAGTVAVLLCHAIRVMLILHREQRHRPISTMYLGSFTAGIAACTVTILDVTRNATATPNGALVNILAILWVGGFSLAALYSWQRRLKPFRTLTDALKQPLLLPPPPKPPHDPDAHIDRLSS